jgi:hypothetical protein
MADPVSHLVLGGEQEERVGSLKYLGTIKDSTLYFNANTQNMNKKYQQHLSCRECVDFMFPGLVRWTVSG